VNAVWLPPPWQAIAIRVGAPELVIGPSSPVRVRSADVTGTTQMYHPHRRRGGVNATGAEAEPVHRV
jgi:hypothetical protein